MLNLVAEERKLIADAQPGTGNLVRKLVWADIGRSKSSHDLKALSVDEIFGNLFVLDFASHDTTAIS